MTTPEEWPANALVDELAAALAEVGTPARATQEKKYLKSELEHFGVTVPQVRKLTRELLDRRSIDTRWRLLALATELWRRSIHELREAGVEALRARADLLQVEDLDFCEARIRQAHTWALVDPLATDVVSPIVMRFQPDPAIDSTLDRWIVDPDFWVRRAALLSQRAIVCAASGDAARFFTYADAQLEEQEFFIRKVIGWVLRDMSKGRPDEVFNWLLPRAHRCSGVTIREAVKYLTPDQREQVLKGWKSDQ
ncbi:MAG: DNA alkylation repair protein [Candidatus Nanopelagicales bacterium]